VLTTSILALHTHCGKMCQLDSHHEHRLLYTKRWSSEDFYTLQQKVNLSWRYGKYVLRPPAVLPSSAGVGAYSSIHINYLLESSAKSPTTNFCTDAPNICLSAGQNFLPLTLLTPRILKLIMSYGKSACICRKINICHYWTYVQPPRPVLLNRRAAARYRALASILPGRERFSWNLTF